MNVDYHMHSLCSDGSNTVEELVALAVKNGIRQFSLTDHDTTAGVAKARALSGDALEFTSGIEFTCRETVFPSAGISCSIHLLGYGFDEENPVLLEALEARGQRTEEVFKELCREISDCGSPVQVEEIPISCGNVLQLCDVEAFLRMKYGTEAQGIPLVRAYCKKLSEANIAPAEAAALIRQAGGKAVWAHPFHVYKNFHKETLQRQQVEQILHDLTEAGIEGIEANYAGFEKEERKWLRDLAEKKGLFCTAGSDYHGSGPRSTMGIETEGRNLH